MADKKDDIVLSIRGMSKSFGPADAVHLCEGNPFH